MSLPYFLRLLCLCLASFFLAHMALALIVWIAAPSAIRLAERMKPRWAAQFLLALRLLPSALAFLFVVGLCVPSYLRFEPQTAAERVGWICFAIAILCAAIWAVSIARVLRVVHNSAGYSRLCRKARRETNVPGEPSPGLVIEEEAPILALAGVLRPRLVISAGVMRALSKDQLNAALRHERAHRISHDNFKRLLILLAPDLFPCSQAFASLESAWAKFAEWAADDHAVEGDSGRALSLAAALVRVARMGSAPRASLFLTSLVAGGQDLSSRVDRLLRPQPSGLNPRRQIRAFIGGTAIVMGISAAAVVLSPTTLYSVHQLLERLVR